jgi:hypothetical protein
MAIEAGKRVENSPGSLILEWNIDVEEEDGSMEQSCTKLKSRQRHKTWIQYPIDENATQEFIIINLEVHENFPG